MDENSISVLCEIDGCFVRLIGAERCSEHGGSPTYEWTDSEFGDVNFQVFNRQPESEEITQEKGANPS